MQCLTLSKPFYQAPKEEGKKKKKGGGKTVSSVYLVSLMELMAQVGVVNISALTFNIDNFCLGILMFDHLCFDCLLPDHLSSVAQLRAALCALPRAEHPQETRRSGAAPDCELSCPLVVLYLNILLPRCTS